MVYIRYCNDDKPYDRVALRLLGIVPVCDGKRIDESEARNAESAFPVQGSEAKPRVLNNSPVDC